MRKVNTNNFKKTLSKFSTGITVVCVKSDNSIYGKTVNSFNSLSLNPPLVLFSLGNYSSSITKFSKTKFLSINILSSKQRKLSDNFASTRPEVENIKFIKGKNKTVIIPNCIANLECKLIDKIKKGDHIIFICKILELQSNNKLKPLVYFNSKYF
ncbi:flavin reductase family protein [Pelagibacteraceae bacterium]|nr:flavin reductase family protein [Pelagibacteraceae bacterium]